MNFEVKNKEKESLYINNLEVLDEYVAEVSRTNLLTPEEFLERTKVR